MTIYRSCIYTLDWILKKSFNEGKDMDRKVGCSIVKDQIEVDKDSKTFQESGKIAGKMWIRISKIQKERRIDFLGPS